MINITDELSFAWRVLMIQKRKYGTNIKSKCRKILHKYGIRLPHSVKEALKLNKEKILISGTKLLLRRSRMYKQHSRSVKKTLSQELTNNLKVSDGFQEVICNMKGGSLKRETR